MYWIRSVLSNCSLECYITDTMLCLLLVVCSAAVQQSGNTHRCPLHSPWAWGGVHLIQLCSGSLIQCDLLVALPNRYTLGEDGAGACNGTDGERRKRMVRVPQQSSACTSLMKWFTERYRCQLRCTVHINRGCITYVLYVSPVWCCSWILAVFALICRTFHVDEMSTGTNELLASDARLSEVRRAGQQVLLCYNNMLQYVPV